MGERRAVGGGGFREGLPGDGEAHLRGNADGADAAGRLTAASYSRQIKLLWDLCRSHAAAAKCICHWMTSVVGAGLKGEREKNDGGGEV